MRIALDLWKVLLMLAGCITSKQFSRKSSICYLLYSITLLQPTMLSFYRQEAIILQLTYIASHLHFFLEFGKQPKQQKSVRKPFPCNVRQLFQVPEEIFVHQHLQATNYLSLLDGQKLIWIRVILQGKLHQQIHALSIPI